MSPRRRCIRTCRCSPVPSPTRDSLDQMQVSSPPWWRTKDRIRFNSACQWLDRFSGGIRSMLAGLSVTNVFSGALITPACSAPSIIAVTTGSAITRVTGFRTIRRFLYQGRVLGLPRFRISTSSELLKRVGSLPSGGNLGSRSSDVWENSGFWLSFALWKLRALRVCTSCFRAWSRSIDACCPVIPVSHEKLSSTRQAAACLQKSQKSKIHIISLLINFPSRTDA